MCIHETIAGTSVLHDTQFAISVQDDGNASTTLYIMTTALSVSVIVNIVQFLYIILLR